MRKNRKQISNKKGQKKSSLDDLYREVDEFTALVKCRFPGLSTGMALMAYGREAGVYTEEDLNEYREIEEWLQTLENGGQQ